MNKEPDSSNGDFLVFRERDRFTN